MANDDRAPTLAEVGAAIGVLSAVADVIRELKEVPSGVLFAQMQTAIPGYTLSSHDAILRLLERTDLVRRKPYNRHVIVWTGGKL